VIRSFARNRVASILLPVGFALATGFGTRVLAQAKPPAGPPPHPLPHPELPEPSVVTIGPPWWVYASVGLLVCALLGLVLWMMFRPKKGVPPAPPRPWKQAMEAMRAIRGRAEAQPASSTAHEVSEALRRYFMDRYRIPAPFRTRRELFEDLVPSKSQRLQRYAPLAELWDQLSFAPTPANHTEAVALVEKAIAHLEEDKP